MGQHVTEVIPASAFGLLPPVLDEKPSPSIDKQQRLEGEKFRCTSRGPHGATFISTTASYSEGGQEGQKGEGMDKFVGRRGGETSPAVLLLLEKIVHLFRHGTPSSLELELNRVGGEALRALQTPDVSFGNSTVKPHAVA